MLRNWRGKEAEKLAINWGSFIMPPASYYDKCFATLRIRNVSLKRGSKRGVAKAQLQPHRWHAAHASTHNVAPSHSRLMQNAEQREAENRRKGGRREEKRDMEAAGNTLCRLSVHANALPPWWLAALRGTCQALLLFIILLPQYFYNALFIDEQTDKLTDRQTSRQTDKHADKCERDRERQRPEEMCLKHSYGNCKWIFQYLLIDSRTQFAYGLMPDIHICLSMAAEWNLPEQVNAWWKSESAINKHCEWQ